MLPTREQSPGSRDNNVTDVLCLTGSHQNPIKEELR